MSSVCAGFYCSAECHNIHHLICPSQQPSKGSGMHYSVDIESLCLR